MGNIDELLDSDLFEDFRKFTSPYDIEQYLKSDFLILEDSYSDEYFMESSASSEESYISIDSNEILSHDIPINPKEWLVKDSNSKRARPPRLFEFLLLLLQKYHYRSYASYKNRAEGIFEIHEPEKVANLWQHVKNRQSNQNMTYDKFARAIRWYYKDGIMKKTNSRYTFQFASDTLNSVLVDENNNIYSDSTDSLVPLS